MKTLARGQIDRNSETLLKQTLRSHEIQRAETTARIVIEEQVNIAVRVGLVTCCRTKQISDVASSALMASA